MVPLKILYCGYRNPGFSTVTEYAEQALRESGCEVTFFNDRDFLLPGTIRQRLPWLNVWELAALNRRLAGLACRLKPDIMFACGGLRVQSGALRKLGASGVRRVLWTLDAPTDGFRALLETAPLYDKIFCAGSEAVDLLRGAGTRNAELLPFACAPEEHKPQTLSAAEKDRFGCDVCFVGSVDPALYPERVRLLESLSDMDLKVWGPGAESIPASSPLKKRVAGGQIGPELWTKAYSAAKVTLCMHYSDPGGKYPCYQASPRVYEAMACGAFLLCDAQKDVMALFKEGTHLAVFRNGSELREKLGYYLANGEKRKTIAAAGLQEVLGRHTYRMRMERVLQSMGGAGTL